ncbi:MAG: EamA family transporter [Puniceicoccaceae bacterium]
MAAPPASTVLGTGALVAVTVIWAFSFGLIERYLSGVDPFFVGAARLILAGLCFLPFLRTGDRSVVQRLELAGIGAVQFGIMYLCYLAAFRHLEAWQVALFSALTPIWVAGIDAVLRRRWESRFFLAAALSVAGAVVIRAKGPPGGDFLQGFLLMQAANAAFAVGQVWFREWKFRHPAKPEKEVFALLYGGALALVAGAALFRGTFAAPPELPPSGWLVLLFLGTVASGLGFFLWNYGASRVSAGFLAAANNLVVPLGVLAAIAITGRRPDWFPLAAGSALILGGLIAGRRRGDPGRGNPPAAGDGAFPDRGGDPRGAVPRRGS